MFSHGILHSGISDTCGNRDSLFGLEFFASGKWSFPWRTSNDELQRIPRTPKTCAREALHTHTAVADRFQSETTDTTPETLWQVRRRKLSWQQQQWRFVITAASCTPAVSRSTSLQGALCQRRCRTCKLPMAKQQSDVRSS